MKKKVNLIARKNFVQATISKYNINADPIMFENKNMEYQSYIVKVSWK